MRTGFKNVLARLVSYSVFEGRPLTTRGRTINPLLVLVYKLILRSRRTAKLRRPPVFVVGMGRSGTTLLGRVLSVHPKIGWLNEPKLLWNTVYPHEDIIGSYSPRRHGRLVLGSAEADEEVRSGMRVLFATYSEVVGRPQVLDKYPELVFRFDFVRTVFPGAKFVILQRSAASAATSIVAWSERHAVAKADWWGLEGRKWQSLYDEIFAHDADLQHVLARSAFANPPVVMAVAEWLATSEAALNASGQDDVFSLKYEDLVVDPDRVLRDLTDFMGLERSSKMEAFGAQVCRPSRDESLNPETLPDALVRRVRAMENRLGYSSFD